MCIIAYVCNVYFMYNQKLLSRNLAATTITITTLATKAAVTAIVLRCEWKNGEHFFLYASTTENSTIEQRALNWRERKNRRTWWSRAKQAWKYTLSRLLLINEQNDNDGNEVLVTAAVTTVMEERRMMMVYGGGDGSNSSNVDNVDGFSTAICRADIE